MKTLVLSNLSKITCCLKIDRTLSYLGGNKERLYHSIKEKLESDVKESFLHVTEIKILFNETVGKLAM